ncbi:thymidine kinase [Plasmodium vivax North Korean]|uniref:Thymidine kinase n=1 Tax=Plasmodium vivax North Korean TaxID=1035514 RepID=A0A0J9TKH3_PLAVI|nr:thymidine kinase [Plasmodium vivax North Korean]
MINNHGTESTYSPSLTVICGPMRSGKSKELFSIIDRLNYRKIHYKIFKPRLDSRNMDNISSRYYSQSSKAIIIDEKNPKEILSHFKEQFPKGTTALVDEAHFFSGELVEAVKTLLSDGVDVVISGLDCDAHMNTFGPMGDLLALAGKVVKLNSVCEFCYNSANFSALKDEEQSFTRENILVGNDQYLVLCLSCYLEHIRRMEKKSLKNIYR